AHLLGHALVVLAAVRSEHDATVAPLRRAGRALTGAAGALLTPWLRAATGDARAGLRRGRALARVRALGEERLEERGDPLLPGRRERRGELDGSAHVAVDVEERGVALLRGRDRLWFALLAGRSAFTGR